MWEHIYLVLSLLLDDSDYLASLTSTGHYQLSFCSLFLWSSYRWQRVSGKLRFLQLWNFKPSFNFGLTKSLDYWKVLISEFYPGFLSAVARWRNKTTHKNGQEFQQLNQHFQKELFWIKVSTFTASALILHRIIWVGKHSSSLSPKLQLPTAFPVFHGHSLRILLPSHIHMRGITLMRETFLRAAF